MDQYRLIALRFSAVTGSDRQSYAKPLLPMAHHGSPAVPSAQMADSLLLQDGCQNRTSSSSSFLAETLKECCEI